MKINEITTNSLKSFIAQVRCVVDGVGSTIVRVGIRCDSLSSARYVLSKTYGHQNLLSLQQGINEDFIDEEVMKPLTTSQLQVKSLEDKSKELKNQAKKVKAQQKVQVAQSQLSKVNRLST
jgi:hypothetical protein